MTILKPGVNCMGIYPANRTGLLIDACAYYRALYHAAGSASRYILLAGWQFDSGIRLLRGEEERGTAGEVRFLAYLESLCEKTPELEIYLLAWDFNVIFTLEREWFQDIIFDWSTNERIHFRFDSNHAAGAAHHQKFVIVDGELAFVGGMDVCANRWDERHHLTENPERVDGEGSPYGAYHDIQSYHTGPVVKVLRDLFMERWSASGGEELDLPASPAPIPIHPGQAFPLDTGLVAVSRTRAPYLESEEKEIHEIRRLFLDAIISADQLIYLENQYFSSQAIYWALVARMAAPNRPRLQIILVLPGQLPVSEQLLLGLTQMKMLQSLQQVAEKTGHQFRAYSSACLDNGERKMTFVHSKLLLVDDRFLTIGSANLTNRSMGLDSELNVSWEVPEPEDEGGLAGDLRRLRASLLAEHAGLYGKGEDHRFEQVEGIVGRLDHLADDGVGRLCRYASDPSLEMDDWPEALEPVARLVDPEKPVDGELIFESLSNSEASSFAKGILKLSRLIIGI